MKQTILNSLTPRRNLSCRLPALCLMLAALNLPAFTYTNFNSTSGLNLVGVTAVVGGALRLTPAADSVVGTAWAVAKQPCASGFDTSFQFRISNPGSRPGTPPGADGLLFTIQNIGPTDPTYHANTAPADGSVSVFFNTFWNWPDSTDFSIWDVSGNSVGVVSNGLYLAQTDLNPRGVNLKDGAVHDARIAFDGTGLTVWLDGVTVLTNVPVPGMASAVDAAGNAWVGFDAGTGWAWENHDILSWSFSPATAPGCVPSPSGLVSWWPAEGNANDAAGNNNGTLRGGVSFTTGRVGRAFSFNGTNSYVEVPDSPALRLTNELTIEFWVKRQQVDWQTDYLVNKGGDWTRGALNYGVAYASAPYDYTLHFLFADGDRGTTSVTDLSWHHVAVVARNGDVDPTFYLDGVPQPVTFRLGASTINLYPSTEPLHIGAQLDPAWNYYSKTIIDEVSIYSRALAAAEIQAIYSAGSLGKCPLGVAPSIITQPASQTVLAGSPATFTVTAVGTAPLQYQWRFNGTNITGATGTSLTLSNVQPAQAGTYAVQVTNASGSTNSANALLTVNPPPPCTPPPSGLVSWWRGEGDGTDSVGTNNISTLDGMTFAAGEVGQGFSFDGGAHTVLVPDAPGLNFGANQDFAIEAWIQPQVETTTYDIMSMVDKRYSNGGTDSPQGYEFCLVSGQVHARFLSTGFGPAGPDLRDGKFHHIAWTLSRTSTTGGNLYVDGSVVLTFDPTPYTGTLSNTQPLRLGNHADSLFTTFFKGVIDEVSIYHRALSSNEIAAIYSAGSAGKCPLGVAPSIITQPASQTVSAGSTATFTVTAAGAPPLSYQWRFNGTNIAGATGTSLTLSNVQPAQAGNYALRVTNAFGSVTSSNALLAVVAPACLSAPSGLVSWWRAEGDASDAVGTNNGTLQGGVTFGDGEVGRAFIFNGSSGFASIPASASLNVGAGSGLTVECWINPSDVSTQRPLVEWNSGSWYGAHLWISVGPPPGNGSGALFANLDDTGNSDHWISSAPGIISAGNWQHVAVTYDKTAGMAKLYYNGAVVAAQAMGSFSPQTGYNLFLGRRPSNDAPTYYSGLLDEVSIYSRALSAAEIAAIYSAGSAGKCPVGVAPSIITQPASQTVLAGSPATFAVTAVGTPKLRYQWRFNGTNIAGAANPSLILTNVEASNAGLYSVRVTNALGSVISSNALLTVNRLPVAQCANVIVSAGANCLANASINHGSFDPDGDPITVRQVPPGPYPLGTNRVTLIVTDNRGASNSCSALVIVLDRTPPALNCPGGKVLEFQDEKGAIAMYSVTATDTCSAVTLAVTPPSGSLFPIGVTPVQARAVDGSGNTAQCTFDVTVLGARGVKSNVLAQLVALRNTSTNRLDGWELSEAIEEMIDALGLDVPNAPGWVREAHRPEHCGQHHHHPAGPLWLNETHVDRARGGWVFANEKAAVQELVEIIRTRGSGIPDAVALNLIDRLVRCDRLLAVVSIQDAAKAGANPKKIAQDLLEVTAGDRDAVGGRPAQAIDHYWNAWTRVGPINVATIGSTAGGKMNVQLPGKDAGRTYVIQASTNLLDWVTVGSVIADAEGNVSYTDPDSDKHPARFYRAVEQ